MSELKPCPFCGGEAELHCNSDETLYGVYCPSCGAQTAHEGFATDQEAVAAWNRRAEPANNPLPSNVKQAIHELSKAIGSDCLLEYPSDAALKTAVYALRVLCEPDNAPLTLDELRGSERY